MSGTDGQDGFDVRTRDRAGVMIVNNSNQTVAYKVLGYHHLDGGLAEPIELVSAGSAAGGANKRETIACEGLGWLQVEIDPAAAATGDVEIIFGTDTDG